MSISAAQIRLSEGLNLLQEFNSSDLHIPCRPTCANRDNVYRTPETNADMGALDLIAACLTTGDVGDVIAAAFDKRERISLVLAKNGLVTAADYNTTRNFFSALLAATDWIDLIPFLVNHGKKNIDKRIRSLHQSLSAFDIESAVQGYSNDSIEMEFPHSVVYRDSIYPDGQPSFNCMLRDLIHKCVDGSDFEVKQDKDSFVKFFLLVETACVLQNSRFLQELTSDPNRLNPGCKENRERLKRRLGKVCQYERIGKLIHKAKQWFPAGDIPFHWVDESFVGTGEGRFELCADPMEAVDRLLGKQISPLDIGNIKKHFPYLIQNWEARRVINPRIHAELRIILHLSRPLLPVPPVPPTVRKQLPIGCSQRTCLGCALWIEAFNALSRMSWMTSGSHGKPYANWALPGAACERIMGGEILWHLADKAVMNGVNIRMVKSLGCLSKPTKRISDEGGSVSDASDSAKDAYRARAREILSGNYARLPYPRNQVP